MSLAITRLASAGEVAQALALLRNLDHPSIELRALQCELEALGGNTATATRLAQEVISRSSSSTASVRALIVAGRIGLFSGDKVKGEHLLRKAVESAQAGQDPGLLAHAIGQQLEAHLRFVGLEAVVGQLGHYKRATFRAASNRSLAFLHKVLAEAELKSGRAHRAVRELELAGLHVEATNDHVLDAQVAFAQGAAHGSIGNIPLALAYATQAVTIAAQCGADAIRRSARVNVASLQTLMGRFEEAAATLQELLSDPFASTDRELDVANNNLQLLNATRSSAAREFADRYCAVAMDRSSVSAQWYRFVRTDCLLTFGEAEAAATLGLKCLEISSRDDRDYLARVGAVTAAALVSGLLSTDSPVTAFEHFARAARVFGHIGHVVGRGEALHNAATLRASIASARGEAIDVPHITTLYTAPPDRFERIDSDEESDWSPEFSSAASIRASAAMVDLVSRPLLAAFELSSLVARSGAAQASIVLAQNGKRPEVVGWAGATEPDKSLLETSESLMRFELGTDAGREVTVVVQPRNQQSARTTLLALQRLVGHALTLHRAAVAESEKSALWPEPLPEQQLGLICTSESMLELMKATQRVAASNITVLISGETGTGKELVARALHNSSPRAGQRFLPFNCTAVAKEMLDSQLFGYRRGAFTGAQDAFPGVIRSAAGGTLFLDEIGEIGLDVQPKLLRFLESSEVHPLGEPAPMTVDVRIVAATNANLDALVAQGKFREDLFYRLNVVKLTIPPLRERREEIPLLVDHFLMRCQKESGKSGIRIGETTAEYLLLYDWPGNVRELVNELRRAVALAESGAVLMPEHLSPRLAATRRTVPVGQRPPTPSELLVRRDQPLSAAVEHVERALIQDALRRHGSVEEAARALGLSRKGLYLKRQRLKIDEQIAEA
jgi:DNA-binding NtrC family response regulator/tetratricopeptide (TPR) repeat protein